MSKQVLYQPSEQPTLWRQKENRLKAIELVEQRFPNTLLHFKEHDPYSLVNKFQLKAIASNEVIPENIASLPELIATGEPNEVMESTNQRDVGEWQAQAALV